LHRDVRERVPVKKGLAPVRAVPDESFPVT
jgi:hypothetical protein